MQLRSLCSTLQLPGMIPEALRLTGGVELSDLWETYREDDVTSLADTLLQEKLERNRSGALSFGGDAKGISVQGPGVLKSLSQTP